VGMSEDAASTLWSQSNKVALSIGISTDAGDKTMHAWRYGFCGYVQGFTCYHGHGADGVLHVTATATPACGRTRSIQSSSARRAGEHVRCRVAARGVRAHTFETE
jgi:hypothetical protein